MTELVPVLESRSASRESLGRHASHVGIAAPLSSGALVVEVATRVLLGELRRRLPALTLQLFAPDPSLGWRRWPDTTLIEALTAETPSMVDALVVLEERDGGEFGWTLQDHLDPGFLDGVIRLPLTPIADEVVVDVDSLLDLAPRSMPDIDRAKVVSGLRSRGMWTTDQAVLVDIRGDERPSWWWSVVQARASAIGASVLTCTFDTSETAASDLGHRHLAGGVGPETMTIAVANAAALITDDPHLARLAKALGTPRAPARAFDAESLNRVLVEHWSLEVGVQPERALAVDLAIDKVAEVASATASLRSPDSFNAATTRLTRRVHDLETAHERIVSRMVAERRTAADSVAGLTSELSQARADLGTVGAWNEQVTEVLRLTQIELHNLQLREVRERPDPARRGWRRWRLLRGVRRLVPGPLRALMRRVARRLRRSKP